MRHNGLLQTGRSEDKQSQKPGCGHVTSSPCEGAAEGHKGRWRTCSSKVPAPSSTKILCVSVSQYDAYLCLCVCVLLIYMFYWVSLHL